MAVVFLMLANFLWFLDKRRFGVWLKTGIVIICIWAYCILTGMSPSIIRAGLMISIVLIGKALNRQTNIFNTVAFPVVSVTNKGKKGHLHRGYSKRNDGRRMLTEKHAD